jgi:hypothetical protein
MISGEYRYPLRLIAFNTVEGWSRDPFEEIAYDVFDWAYDAERRNPRWRLGGCDTLRPRTADRSDVKACGSRRRRSANNRGKSTRNEWCPGEDWRQCCPQSVLVRGAGAYRPIEYDGIHFARPAPKIRFRIADSDLKRPWTAIAKRAGLKGVRLHDLRHTYASFGAGSGLGLHILGKLLGQPRGSPTMDGRSSGSSRRQCRGRLCARRRGHVTSAGLTPITLGCPLECR